MAQHESTWCFALDWETSGQSGIDHLTVLYSPSDHGSITCTCQPLLHSQTSNILCNNFKITVIDVHLVDAGTLQVQSF